MFKIVKINPNITAISLGGVDSNVYLIQNEILIDATSGLRPETLLDAIKKAGAKPQKIKTVLHTHCHFDHVGGNKLFENASIAIHSKDATVLKNKDGLASYAVFFGNDMSTVKKADIILADGEKIRADNLILEVIHTPGHTPGSICLYEPKDKILFSGDTVFSSTAGRTDLLGSNETELKNSLKLLSKLDINTILPGHGSLVLGDGNAVIKKLEKQVRELS